MNVDLKELIEHDMGDDCPVCRALDVVGIALIPAAAAWESDNELPRFSVALHGAAELLGVMLAEGVRRDDLEDALRQLLDEIEARIAEHQMMGGPPQGTA